MKKEALIVLVLAAIGIGLFFMFRSAPKTIQTPPSEVISEKPVVQESTETAINVKTIEVTNQGFKFIPNEITVKKGDTVKIVFTSSGGMHDLVIDEFNVRTDRINTGKSDSFEFVADKAGIFEYYCSVLNHRAMGMVGKLIVEE